MQQHYVHSVRQDAGLIGTKTDSNRIAIIFRDGKQELMSKDSGQDRVDMSPTKPVSYHFGRHMVGLSEGAIFPRSELLQNGYHR